ncbi:MAG TPA: hypothetical protein VFU46_03820 [Gemmatimonadales bacterium]|nr:hypothetical protein [Gemmatimonadales bacterium]
MARFEARVKEQHRRQYPELKWHTWYEVVPLWPGMRKRTVNLSGERLARLKTPHDYVMVRAAHLEFRPVGAAEQVATG